MAYDINEMKEALRKTVCKVEFTKKNGDHRVMECTLNESMIPESDRPKNEDTKYSDNVVRVYDLRAAGWRSFVAENVISFQ